MDSAVLSALITAGGMGATAISGISLIRYKLGRLEKKVDEHNGYAQMFAQTHEDVAIIKNDMQYVKEDIKELKERSKHHG